MRPISWRRPFFCAAGLGAAGVLALCAAVLLVGLRLSRPATTVVGPVPPELAGAQAVAIGTAPGSAVQGWWWPGRVPGGGAVLLMHGVWENRRRMVPRARVLHEHGFGVLLIDLQAHGESPGRSITFGAREGLDATAAIRFLRNQVPGERVGVIGVSLGGAAAVLEPQPALDALVLESVYPDIDAALDNRLRAGLRGAGPWIAPVLAPLFKMLLPPILGVTPGELRPIDRIGRVAAPVLVASGTVDDRTPLPEARALFDQAREPKQFWAVQGAAHEDLERFDPAAYWRVVLPFLATHLQAPRGEGDGG